MLTLYIPDADPQDLTLASEIRREAALLMYKRNNWSIVRAARYALCHPRASIYWCVAIGK